MEKAYKVSDIRFEDNYLILRIDDKLIRLKLDDISEKLAKATDKERSEFRVTPSGYGIHWTLLDEDLSINGLLKSVREQN
jgi:hypothetical protein